jgi:hypothetical protein
MKTAIKLIVIIAMLMGSGLLSLAFLMTDDQPTVIETDKVTPQSLSDSKKLLKHIDHTLRMRNGDKSILIPFDSLNAIFALTSEILRGFSARYNDLGDQILISTSIELPINPVGNYINISLQIGNDHADTDTSRTAIGGLSLSNATVITTASVLINMFMDDAIMPHDGPFIRSISIQNRAIKILFHPELNTRKLFTSFKRAGKGVATNMLPGTDLREIQPYYDHLAISTRHLTKKGMTVSLFTLLKMVMSLAEKTSDESNAKKKNTSALIALALFAGDRNLTFTLNGLINIKLGTHKKLKIKLNEREDLMLHFLYSSTIHIMSNSGISFSIGEIKEVSDSGKGGSGFSFVDIAADKAGIKFAEFATSGDRNARLLQQRLSMATSEKDIFPDISALRENISEERFKSLYMNRQSDEYKAILSDIDRRIDALPIYRE